ncbi:hypothetical protein ABI_32860 [Asticcacaulis biprosthecium C19]|uniref:Uncharacterized protein n=2 Tax=Asticcacaulis biprosthecium TaxID=76891 RepID=F4QPY3_9CAUL|nr:hypothetical protein ABI_32860 [Asticcacaulis biprosthecium C19]
MLGLAAISAVSVSYAGSARPDGDSRELTRSRSKCFDPDFVRSFDTVNNHKIVVTSDRNEAFELTLGGVCIGLDTSFQIGIRSRHGFSDICGPFDGDIVWSDGLRGLQSCPITDMRRLEGEEAAEYVRGGRSGRNDERK